MLLGVRISSCGCTREVWRALKKLKLFSATLTHLSCPPNFPRASITRYTDAKHEQILKCKTVMLTTRNQLGATRKQLLCCSLIQKDWLIYTLSEEYLTTILLCLIIKRVPQILQKRQTQGKLKHCSKNNNTLIGA